MIPEKIYVYAFFSFHCVFFDILLILKLSNLFLLLCTDKNHALAEYALAGMDNNLFVSKYMLELPKKEEMQKIIEKELNLNKE
ncbi:PDDEXK nuclease domain-containing protein [Legionella bozemanae]|uniref:Ankyrin repeat protein n=1 Tax=Legionella bozemanae TaxID=447 RepID=A0A0W0R9W0_LEGBO|nr:PDDEXK nuclease domain-containing protein [Legionella bozemanae]KTC67844.1 hypothetical protein Lboz_3487 [Legionella bozemanae]STP14003.1 Uncharacterized conserved protein [Legionella bozemanae]